jgi:hypothetical protein
VKILKYEEVIESNVSRRGLLNLIGAGTMTLAAGGLLAGCGGNSTSVATKSASGGNMDAAIINAAAVAEALATTMYYNLIKGAIYADLAGNAPDRAYLVAGFEQELDHYNALVSLGATPVPTGTNFYFPTNMFTDKQTTVNTLVTLEDAFIAAYLIGVRDFLTNASKVIAGQILGVESEHRTLARVVANDLGLTYTQGLSGVPESVVAPSHTANNLAYERTFSSALPNINAVVTALGPFLKPGSAGYSSTGFAFAGPHATLPPGTPSVALDDTMP